jgi:hypothetical protein
LWLQKWYDNQFFSSLSYVEVFGSGIRDPRSGIQDPGWVKIRIRDPGSGINIPDPQHCINLYKIILNSTYGTYLKRITEA